MLSRVVENINIFTYDLNKENLLREVIVRQWCNRISDKFGVCKKVRV